MTLVLDRLPQDFANKVMCYYLNQTQKVQVARISNITNWYLERVIFPGEYLLFEAPSDADLEIYQASKDGIELLEQQLCEHLRVEEGNEIDTQ
ncbi:MAG: DUF1830 domain-containing protein [Microcoleaceae cyanobacterium]